MKSIAFFNNKGGVGKTTLTCNVVSFLNKNMGKRVLLVDADPQCNATQAILSDEECESLYLTHDSDEKTLFDYLKPIEEGEVTLIDRINPMLGSRNRFSTDLIPGHPMMSLVEDKLSAAWTDLLSGTPSGFRITNWPEQLFEKIGSSYDLVVFDVGPSLGALNRTVILASDYIVTPFGCDIFSILGIQNITSWMRSWKLQYDRAISNMKDDRPNFLHNYPIVVETDKKFRFAGYSVQQYVTRSFKSGKRPVKAYDRIMQKIPDTVISNLEDFRVSDIGYDQLELGHIPYLYSLVPLAQSERSPIHALKETGRLVGSQYQQAENFYDLIETISNKLLQNIGLE